MTLCRHASWKISGRGVLEHKERKKKRGELQQLPSSLGSSLAWLVMDPSSLATPSCRSVHGYPSLTYLCASASCFVWYGEACNVWMYPFDECGGMCVLFSLLSCLLPVLRCSLSIYNEPKSPSLIHTSPFQDFCPGRPHITYVLRMN